MPKREKVYYTNKKDGRAEAGKEHTWISVIPLVKKCPVLNCRSLNRGNPVSRTSRHHPVEIKEKSLGNDLLSQAVASQVPSALMSLTAGFEM